MNTMLKAVTVATLGVGLGVMVVYADTVGQDKFCIGTIHSIGEGHAEGTEYSTVINDATARANRSARRNLQDTCDSQCRQDGCPDGWLFLYSELTDVSSEILQSSTGVLLGEGYTSDIRVKGTATCCCECRYNP